MAKLHVGDVFIYDDEDEGTFFKSVVEKVERNDRDPDYVIYHHRITEWENGEMTPGYLCHTSSYEDDWIRITQRAKTPLKNLSTTTPKGERIKCLIKKSY